MPKEVKPMTSEMSKMTWYLHITGQVQGVGFRPTVYRIAKDYNLVGQVRNASDGLHVIFNASKEIAFAVKEEICHQSLPLLARITNVSFHEVTYEKFEGFNITHSTHGMTTDMVLTPDVALCIQCSEELSGQDDRRYAYSFNSCSTCGPRFSIIDQLPYDRANTRMAPFEMCATCKTEYSAPTDRRYYAQTISCPDCAIGLKLYRSNAEMLSSDNTEIIKRTTELWQNGNIIAIKGIGGYLLTCDAENEDVIKRLRQLKHRPSKPFAVMYPSLASLEPYNILTEAKEMLTSHVSPIVLMPKNEKANICNGICDSQDRVGVMLPYAPIFKVLLNQFEKPIIATSGNVSNAPIVFKDEEAFEQLSEVADFIITNERDIVIPQDDSVIKFTEVHSQKIILRRSRGLAPSYINPELKIEEEPFLATGAQLKSSFSLYQSKNVYISQYLGDLDNFVTMSNYKHCLLHLTELLKIKPQRILSDVHKGYASTSYAHQLAKKWNVPIKEVQHHKAHFSALLGEHNLMNSDEPILGVVWDGAGLGEDEAIWGSEFFIYNNHQFDRCAHLAYFDLFLGDKMAKEPRLSALSLAHDLPMAEDVLLSKFSKTEWKVYAKMLDGSKHIQSSSMGRLFDAVASIIGCPDVQSFEGEAAMMLEDKARIYLRSNSLKNFKESYFVKESRSLQLSPKMLIQAILSDLSKGIDKGLVAAKFHLTLIEWIEFVADEQNCKNLAFSGGVFQNGLLIDFAITHLSKDHKLYFHKELSPNDENISFGQLIYHQITKKEGEND